MEICAVCGALLKDKTAGCEFDGVEAQAPWLGDYDAMARGEMSHSDHQVVVARWVLHHHDSRSERVLKHFGEIAKTAWGRPMEVPRLPPQPPNVDSKGHSA